VPKDPENARIANVKVPNKCTSTEISEIVCDLAESTAEICKSISKEVANLVITTTSKLAKEKRIALNSVSQDLQTQVNKEANVLPQSSEVLNKTELTSSCIAHNVVALSKLTTELCKLYSNSLLSLGSPSISSTPSALFIENVTKSADRVASEAKQICNKLFEDLQNL